MIGFYIMSCNYSMNNIIWRAVCIYDYPKSNKTLTRNLINNLAQRHNYTNWLFFCDSNIIFYDSEKIRGNLLDHNLTHIINTTFTDC